MGAKTELLAFADGRVADVLRQPGTADAARATTLLRRLAPTWSAAPTKVGSLHEAADPPAGASFVLSVPGLDLVCGLDFLGRHSESRLPVHILAEGAGRTIVHHRTNSATDSVEIAVWRNGALVRAVSIAGAKGVVADVGEPLEFETPFWDGQFGAEAGAGQFPTPFHPLAFGDTALRALFGFGLEDSAQPDAVDPHLVPMFGFQLTDPHVVVLPAQRRIRRAPSDLAAFVVRNRPLARAAGSDSGH